MKCLGPNFAHAQPFALSAAGDAVGWFLGFGSSDIGQMTVGKWMVTHQTSMLGNDQ